MKLLFYLFSVPFPPLHTSFTSPSDPQIANPDLLKRPNSSAYGAHTIPSLSRPGGVPPMANIAVAVAVAEIFIHLLDKSLLSLFFHFHPRIAPSTAKIDLPGGLHASA